MSELSDDYKFLKEQGKDRRNKNLEFSTAKLDEFAKAHNIKYESKNNGTHIIIENIDYWPSTGLFIDRKTGKRFRGIRNLIDLIKKIKGIK